MTRRRIRLRPRFFLWLALVLGLATLVWIHAVAKPPAPTSRHAKIPPAPTSQPVLVATPLPGAFKPAPVALPIPLANYAVVNPTPATAELIGGYTRDMGVNPIVYTLTAAGAIAASRMRYPDAAGGAALIATSIRYFGGASTAGVSSARIQAVRWTSTPSPTTPAHLAGPLSEMATVASASGPNGPGTVFLVGGKNAAGASSLIYRWRKNTGAKVWAHLPIPLEYPMAALYRHQLWIIGGYNPTAGYSRSVYTVNLLTGRTKHVATLQIGIADGALVQFHNALWVLGGQGPQGSTRTTFALKPSRSGQVLAHPGPKLPESVFADSAFVLSGNLWVGGGFTGTSTPTTWLWRYQPASSTKHSHPNT